MNSIGMPGAVSSNPIAIRARLRAYQDLGFVGSASRAIRGSRWSLVGVADVETEPVWWPRHRPGIAGSAGTRDQHRGRFLDRNVQIRS